MDTSSKNLHRWLSSWVFLKNDWNQSTCRKRLIAFFPRLSFLNIISRREMFVRGWIANSLEMYFLVRTRNCWWRSLVNNVVHMEGSSGVSGGRPQRNLQVKRKSKTLGVVLDLALKNCSMGSLGFHGVWIFQIYSSPQTEWGSAWIPHPLVAINFIESFD